jgi:hypothetical protein
MINSSVISFYVEVQMTVVLLRLSTLILNTIGIENKIANSQISTKYIDIIRILNLLVNESRRLFSSATSNKRSTLNAVIV